MSKNIRKKMKTKHQALHNLLVGKLGYKKDVQIESGFEGDTLWVDEEEEWEFIEAEGWDLKRDREDFNENVGIDNKTKVYQQDGWFFWKNKE